MKFQCCVIILHITIALALMFLGDSLGYRLIKEVLKTSSRCTITTPAEARRSNAVRYMRTFRLRESSVDDAIADGDISPVIPVAEGGGSDGSTGSPVVRRKRVLSGVQPTGSLHLGNYLGAIRQWVSNQDTYDNYFCVVDLHAITAPHDPKSLSRDTIQAAAMYVACGIDPSKSKVFIQSHVTAHSELAWLLNCITPINWLERMIQYKEKALKQGDNVGVGLFDYPVLMAADILLYQADLVPVGEDQRQHLELTRDIARRFNDQFCNKRGKRKTFKEPNALIVKEGARVMSLQDGTSKMSKSAENDFSRINLLDSPDVISSKIKKCKTDLFKGLEWDNPDRPEAKNLLNIYQAVTNRSKEEVLGEVGSMSWGTFKPLLAEAVVAHLSPIQHRYREVMQDEAYLSKVLADGKEAADLIAEQTLGWAKTAMGFYLPKASVELLK